MRVLFTSLRNTSHFLPLTPFIEACRARGHEVAVAAPIDLAERVASTGAELFPFGHPGDAGLAPLWAKLRGATQEDAKRVVITEIFAGVCASTALPQLLETMQRWQPSIVVRETMEHAAVLAAEKLGVVHARVGITLRRAELEVLPFAAPALEGHARGLGLSPDPTGQRILREPVLTMFPASLEGPEAKGAPVQRFRAAQKPAAPLPAWWGARQEPLVYVTLGTVAGGMEQLRAAYRRVLDAVSPLPNRVLLTIGAELPFEALGEVPANVHVERFVPQQDVLPHAAAVLCHGGSGTVVGTLAAGVPMLVAPLFADQPVNAEAVMASGAGLGLPVNDVTSDAVRRALLRVMHEPGFRTNAQRIAAEIALLPSMADAALELERLALAR